MPGKVPKVIVDASTTELGFESPSVFPLPLQFNLLDLFCLGRRSPQRGPLPNARQEFSRTIRLQKLLFAFVTEHSYQRLVNVDRCAVGIASVYTVSGIVHQRAIERLRVSQGDSSLFQLLAEFLLVESPANCHGQLRDVLSCHAVERAVGSDLYNGLTPLRTGYEKQGDLLKLLL